MTLAGNLDDDCLSAVCVRGGGGVARLKNRGSSLILD